MAINPYAWPALAGTKFRAVNLCNHPSDSGNGGFGVPAPFYDFWYDWPWTTWIKPQIDAAAALGCNCVRVMSDATVRYGDVSHHGAATWRGTITSGAFASQWDQLITYCAGLGIYVYATGTESRPVATSGISKANLTSYLEEFVGVVSSASYNNVPALDLVQEWTQGGTVVTDTGNLEDLIAASKAALDKQLPVTCSQNGAADSGDLDYDTDLALQRIAFSGVDFVDVHVYYFAPVSDYYPLFGSLAIVSMERGIDYNGGFTSGAVGGGSAAARESFYDQFLTVTQDYRLQANGAWAITQQSITDSGNDWGLFGITQNVSSPYAFTDERTEMTTQFKQIPKTIQTRDPVVDPGPTMSPAPSVDNSTSTTITLAWSAADGGTGTKTYVPQLVAADADGFPASMTWTDGSSTTSTTGTLTGLTASTDYIIRIKVTDSASPTVTNYSSWLSATTASAGTATIGWKTV